MVINEQVCIIEKENTSIKEFALFIRRQISSLNTPTHQEWWDAILVNLDIHFLMGTPMTILEAAIKLSPGSQNTLIAGPIIVFWAKK